MSSPANPSPATSSNPSVAIVCSVLVLLGSALWLLLGWHLTRLHALVPGGVDWEAPLAQARALAWGGLVCLGALGWGAPWVRFCMVSRGWVRLGVAGLLGSATLGTVVLLLGLGGWLRLAPTAVFVGLAGLPGLVRGIRWCLPRVGGRGAWCLVVVGVVAGVGLLAALAPATQSDGVRYHLVGPQEYIKQGRIASLPYQAFTQLPSLVNMLYLVGMQGADARVGQLLHWMFLGPLALFAAVFTVALQRTYWCTVGRPGPATTDAPWLAGALVVSVPVVAIVGAWPFVDVASAAFLTAGAWAYVARGVRGRWRAPLAGLLCGAAVAAKLSALPAGGLLGVVVLGDLLRRRRPGAAAGFVASAALFPLPWLLKSWVFTGNPLYPAAFGIFGGRFWSAENAAFYASKAAEKGMGHGLLDLLASPVRASLYYERFESQCLGPVLLALAAFVVLAIARMARSRALFSPAGLLAMGQLFGAWVAWFATYQSNRFLLVPIVFFVSLAVVGVESLAGSAPWHRLARRLALLPAALGTVWVLVYQLAVAPECPVAAGLGLVPSEVVLTSSLGYYEAAASLNRQPSEPVFFIGEHRALYCQFPVIHSDWFDTPRILAEIRATSDNDALLASWRSRGIHRVLYNEAELSQYAALYFRPRFTAPEWERFLDLMKRLRPCSTARFEPGVYIMDLSRLGASQVPPGK